MDHKTEMKLLGGRKGDTMREEKRAVDRSGGCEHEQPGVPGEFLDCGSQLSQALDLCPHISYLEFF